ncbi:MAG: methyltransferase domain-containing protein [Methanomassiliicoccus sp.]|nr:methyltransferase domain-containing protein [Methanomassiliicoccus sp.]
MTAEDQALKGAIRKKWDLSSSTYDSDFGHGIKDGEERDAWKRYLGTALPTKGCRVLDVGCGTGEISLLLAEMGYGVKGVDLSEDMMNKARTKASQRGLNATFENGDAENLQFGAGSFDVVVNRHLLWTLPHPERALQEWMRVVTVGGSVIVIDGVWNDGTIGTKFRRAVRNIAIAVVDRKNPWGGYYGRDVNSRLPHPGGVPPEKTREYMEKAGLVNVTAVDLTEIRRIQSASMPRRYRVANKWNYFLVKGIKKV